MSWEVIDRGVLLVQVVVQWCMQQAIGIDALAVMPI